MARSSSWTNAERTAHSAFSDHVAKLAAPGPRRMEVGAQGRILPELSRTSPKRISWTTSRTSSNKLYDEKCLRVSEQVFLSDQLLKSKIEHDQVKVMEVVVEGTREPKGRGKAPLVAVARPLRPSYSPYEEMEQDILIQELDESSTTLNVSPTSSRSPRKLRAMSVIPSHPLPSQKYTVRPPVSPKQFVEQQSRTLNTALNKNAESSRDLECTVEKMKLELDLARKNTEIAEKRADTLEEKFRVLLEEKLNGQKEIKAMREQVADQKLRQASLCREVEAAKRRFNAEMKITEHELHAAQEENVLLRTQASELKDQMNVQACEMENIVRQAQDDKAKYVAMMEEERHRLQEWKEGEVLAQKVAHNQIVQDLKTEHELKLEHLQSEMQKLQQDLEVTRKLLQKSRTLSPLEPSLRRMGSGDKIEEKMADMLEVHKIDSPITEILLAEAPLQTVQSSTVCDGNIAAEILEPGIEHDPVLELKNIIDGDRTLATEIRAYDDDSVRDEISMENADKQRDVDVNSDMLGKLATKEDGSNECHHEDSTNKSEDVIESVPLASTFEEAISEQNQTNCCYSLDNSDAEQHEIDTGEDTVTTPKEIVGMEDSSCWQECQINRMDVIDGMVAQDRNDKISFDGAGDEDLSSLAGNFEEPLVDVGEPINDNSEGFSASTEVDAVSRDFEMEVIDDASDLAGVNVVSELSSDEPNELALASECNSFDEASVNCIAESTELVADVERSNEMKEAEAQIEAAISTENIINFQCIEEISDSATECGDNKLEPFSSNEKNEKVVCTNQPKGIIDPAVADVKMSLELSTPLSEDTQESSSRDTNKRSFSSLDMAETRTAEVLIAVAECVAITCATMILGTRDVSKVVLLGNNEESSPSVSSTPICETIEDPTDTIASASRKDKRVRSLTIAEVICPDLMEVELDATIKTLIEGVIAMNAANEGPKSIRGKSLTSEREIPVQIDEKAGINEEVFVGFVTKAFSANFVEMVMNTWSSSFPLKPKEAAANLVVIESVKTTSLNFIAEMECIAINNIIANWSNRFDDEKQVTKKSADTNEERVVLSSVVLVAADELETVQDTIDVASGNDSLVQSLITPRTADYHDSMSFEQDAATLINGVTIINVKNEDRKSVKGKPVAIESETLIQTDDNPAKEEVVLSVTKAFSVNFVEMVMNTSSSSFSLKFIQEVENKAFLESIKEISLEVITEVTTTAIDQSIASQSSPYDTLDSAITKTSADVLEKMLVSFTSLAPVQATRADILSSSAPIANEVHTNTILPFGDDELNLSGSITPPIMVKESISMVAISFTVAKDFVDKVMIEAVCGRFLLLQSQESSRTALEHGTKSKLTCSGIESYKFSSENANNGRNSAVGLIAQLARHYVETMVITALNAVIMKTDSSHDNVVTETLKGEEPTTLDANKFSAQEIVQDVAFVFASQAISIGLKRFYQSNVCPSSESKLSDTRPSVQYGSVIDSENNSVVQEVASLLEAEATESESERLTLAWSDDSGDTLAVDFSPYQESQLTNDNPELSPIDFAPTENISDEVSMVLESLIATACMSNGLNFTVSPGKETSIVEKNTSVLEDVVESIIKAVERLCHVGIYSPSIPSLDSKGIQLDTVYTLDSLLEIEVQNVVTDLCEVVDEISALKLTVGFENNGKRNQLGRARSEYWRKTPLDAAYTEEILDVSARRRARKRWMVRCHLVSLLAFPDEMARAKNSTLVAYGARHEQGQIFSLLDQSILNISRTSELNERDERLENRMIGKRTSLTQELHSKTLAQRQIPQFNYMPMCIKFQWSDFVVATPVRPSNSRIGQGHVSKSPVEPMRLLQRKEAQLPCGSFVIISAFIRPLEDGNENLRVQIDDLERFEEFQFDFSEDLMKKYHFESSGIEAQSLEFLANLAFRRDEDNIIIKLPEKKAGEFTATDSNRMQSERTMGTAFNHRKSKQK